MRVRVLLFGPEADALERSALDVDAPEACRCSDLRTALAEQHPGIVPFLRAGRFAVNCEFAADDRVVRASDEVALIGLVSGG